VAFLEEDAGGRTRQEDWATSDHEAISVEAASITLEANYAAERLRNFYDTANTIGLGYFECDVSGRLTHANV